MLPAGLSGLSAAVARYSMRCIFHRLVNKYKQADAAAQVDQVRWLLHMLTTESCSNGFKQVSLWLVIIPHQRL
jgi:hypothetical protein